MFFLKSLSKAVRRAAGKAHYLKVYFSFNSLLKKNTSRSKCAGKNETDQLIRSNGFELPPTGLFHITKSPLVLAKIEKAISDATKIKKYTGGDGDLGPKECGVCNFNRLSVDVEAKLLPIPQGTIKLLNLYNTSTLHHQNEN